MQQSEKATSNDLLNKCEGKSTNFVSERQFSNLEQYGQNLYQYCNSIVGMTTGALINNQQ